MRSAPQREPQREPSPEAKYLAVYLDRIATALEALNQNVAALTQTVTGMEQRSQQEQRAKSRARR